MQVDRRGAWQRCNCGATLKLHIKDTSFLNWSLLYCSGNTIGNDDAATAMLHGNGIVCQRVFLSHLSCHKLACVIQHHYTAIGCQQQLTPVLLYCLLLWSWDHPIRVLILPLYASTSTVECRPGGPRPMKGLHLEIDLLVTVFLPAPICKPISNSVTSVTDRMLCGDKCATGAKQRMHVMLIQWTDLIQATGHYITECQIVPQVTWKHLSVATAVKTSCLLQTCQDCSEFYL